MKIRQMVIGALLIALTAVLTVAVRIPIVGTGGYLNLGDTIIFISGLLFGPLMGMIAGGIGSALADLYGFPAFAPLTLIVKGLEGLVAGAIFKATRKALNEGSGVAMAVVSTAVGGAVMITGYFLGEAIMFGLLAAAGGAGGGVPEETPVVGYLIKTFEIPPDVQAPATYGITKAATEIPFNIIQAAGSIILGVAATVALARAGLQRYWKAV
jgi:uncharacterized membrane protein